MWYFVWIVLVMLFALCAVLSAVVFDRQEPLEGEWNE